MWQKKLSLGNDHCFFQKYVFSLKTHLSLWGISGQGLHLPLPLSLSPCQTQGLEESRCSTTSFEEGRNDLSYSSCIPCVCHGACHTVGMKCTLVLTTAVRLWYSRPSYWDTCHHFQSVFPGSVATPFLFNSPCVTNHHLRGKLPPLSDIS